MSHRRDLLTRGPSAPRFPPRTQGCAGAESLTKTAHRPIMGAPGSARPHWPPPESTPPRSVRQPAQPSLENPPFGFLLGELDGPFVAGPGLRRSAQPPA